MQMNMNHIEVDGKEYKYKVLPVLYPTFPNYSTLFIYTIYAGSDELKWKRKFLFFGPMIPYFKPVFLFSFVDEYTNIEETVRKRIHEYSKR